MIHGSSSAWASEPRWTGSRSNGHNPEEEPNASQICRSIATLRSSKVMEAENPEPDKLQPRVSAAIYSGWLGAAVGSNCLSSSNVLTCVAVSIPHTACEAP